MAEYIEREAVKKALHDNTIEMEQSIAYSSNIGVPEEDIEYVIDEIPAADVVEVVHGKWLKTKYPEQYQCSECYYEWTVRGMCRETPRDNDAFYCPCCGAQMDGENNE